MSAKCERHGCNAIVGLHEEGDLRCLMGHTQRELLDGLARSMAELVRGPLRELREEIIERLDEQGVEFESLHEAVEALRLQRVAEPAPAAYNDLATEARRIGRSRDWLRDHARDLGGTQPKPRGRWYFQPAVTDTRLGALEGGEAKPAARSATPPRRLPGNVPLLPVKDKAA